MRFQACNFIGSIPKLVDSALITLFHAGSFHKLAAATLAAFAIGISSVLIAEPALAMPSYHDINPIAFATMSNKADAAAKDAEGKLQSAYGDLTGDTGNKVKGQAKQVQASAMNAAEDIKEGTKSAAKNVADAAKKITK